MRNTFSPLGERQYGIVDVSDILSWEGEMHSFALCKPRANHQVELLYAEITLSFGASNQWQTHGKHPSL